MLILAALVILVVIKIFSPLLIVLALNMVFGLHIDYSLTTLGGMWLMIIGIKVSMAPIRHRVHPDQDREAYERKVKDQTSMWQELKKRMNQK